MPMDPMSWVVLYNAHHDALADLIASNMRHRLPPETLRQTPAASVRAPRRIAGGAPMPSDSQRLLLDDHATVMVHCSHASFRQQSDGAAGRAYIEDQNVPSQQTNHQGIHCSDHCVCLQEKAPGPTPDGGLVLELLRAAIHSRAAYGYAMQAGHVSSVLNFALMHAVHSFRCGRVAIGYCCRF